MNFGNRLKTCPRCGKDEAELLHCDEYQIFDMRRRYKLACRNCRYSTGASVSIGETITWWNEGTEVKDDE